MNASQIQRAHVRGAREKECVRNARHTCPKRMPKKELPNKKKDTKKTNTQTTYRLLKLKISLLCRACIAWCVGWGSRGLDRNKKERKSATTPTNSDTFAPHVNFERVRWGKKGKMKNHDKKK